MSKLGFCTYILVLTQPINGETRKKSVRVPVIIHTGLDLVPLNLISWLKTIVKEKRIKHDVNI